MTREGCEGTTWKTVIAVLPHRLPTPTDVFKTDLLTRYITLYITLGISRYITHYDQWALYGGQGIRAEA